MSIFLRYSPVPVILSEPFERTDSKVNGNLITVDFPNRWASDVTSFSTSGWISLSSQSGILLNTPGYVDASGIRANIIYSQTFTRIDSSGNPLDFYSGSNSGIMIKIDNNTISGSNYYRYNRSIDRITIPTATTGRLLYISHGLEEGFSEDINNPSKAITQYNYISLIPSYEIDAGSSPSIVSIDSDLMNINSDLTIAPNLDGYAGRILTHMGSGNPVAWKEANFLPAGIEYYKFAKRPVLIEQNRIIFYTSRPSWVPESDWSSLTQSVLEKEFAIDDTIELENSEAEVAYIKFADSLTYLTYNPPVDGLTNISYSDIVSTVSFTDPVSNVETNGIAISYCPGDALEEAEYPVVGYARSVRKGNYLTMVLASGTKTKEQFSCDPEEDDSPFTFRPSTANTISTRPNIYTSFNQMAEDIDFIVYGKKNIQYDNYISSIFDLNSNLIPIGLVPAFKIDATITNSVSGSPSSGVYFTRYLDRERLQPSGWGLDDSAKVMVNTSGAYVVASLASGTQTLQTHANLTVSGITYSDYIITKEIYLKPEPLEDGSSDYVANAILTLDSKGRIISQKPTQNATKPGQPTNLTVTEIGNKDIGLEWTAPTDNGGSDIISYIVQFSANGGVEWTTLPTNVITLNRAYASQTFVSVGNLSVSTSYIFRVAAQNSVGVGDYSSSSASVSIISTVPEQPQNFTAERFDDVNEIHLSWSAGHSGTSSILGYLIEESVNNGTTWIYYNQPTNLITDTSIIIDGADPDINYLYRISALNSSGSSTYSYASADSNVEPPIPPDPNAFNWDFGKVLFTGVCS